MLVQVLPHLWLGDAHDARDTSSDASLVINCTKDVPFYYDHYDQFRIPVNAKLEESQQLFDAWCDHDDIFEAIYQNIARGNDVLVHCYAGRQRSAATVAAFLIHPVSLKMETLFVIK